MLPSRALELALQHDTSTLLSLFSITYKAITDEELTPQKVGVLMKLANSKPQLWFKCKVEMSVTEKAMFVLLISEDLSKRPNIDPFVKTITGCSEQVTIN